LCYGQQIAESDGKAGDVANGITESVDKAFSLSVEDEESGASATPKCLVYLDRLCDRRRVECVVHTLGTAAAAAAVTSHKDGVVESGTAAVMVEKRLVSRLYDIGCRYCLTRLCRIIDDIEAFSVSVVH